MMKLFILRVNFLASCSGLVDKISSYERKITRSNPAQFFSFIFKLEKILGCNLIFSTSYSSMTDLESLLGLLLVSFIWPWEKFH